MLPRCLTGSGVLSVLDFACLSGFPFLLASGQRSPPGFKECLCRPQDLSKHVDKLTVHMLTLVESPELPGVSPEQRAGNNPEPPPGAGPNTSRAGNKPSTVDSGGLVHEGVSPEEGPRLG